MSDIGLMEGLGVFVGICVTLAIGAAFLLVALVAAVVQHRRTPGERLRPRIMRFIAGPLACMTVGAASTLAFAFGSATSDRSLLGFLDDVWVLFPLAGVTAGALVSAAIALARRRRRDLLPRS